jgi:nucleoid DNA-binding protein
MIWIKKLTKKFSTTSWLTHIDSEKLIRDFVELMKNELIAGEKINLEWFARFNLVERKWRPWTCPFSWAAITIDPRVSMKMETSKPFHDFLKNLSINK